MSKDSSNKKHPLPSNNPEKFMAMVYVLADTMGIDDIPNVYHYVELLGDAVARHSFETHHKVSPQKKVHNDRKRFIAIFKTRYQQLLDLEYTKTVTPAEAKLINQTNRALLKESFTVDDFLKWVFEDFLVENPKFRPPTIKSVCAQYCLHSFIDANQALREAKKRQEIDKKAGLDLIQRARGLRRMKDIDKKDDERLKEVLEDYSKRRIMLSEFRKVVEDLEATYGQQGQT
jgi:hypothetical protein